MLTNSYYGNINPTLLDAMNPTAKVVCEFGCGEGALARAYKQKNPNVHYIGIELMAQAAEKAKEALDVTLVRHLDRIGDWTTDAELSAALPLNSLDLAVFGDVLEHLYDPDDILKQTVARLKVDGQVVACIPNVQHWSTLIHLIRGDWPRQESGLFDRTHIRWFTLKEMRRAFENSGLIVEKIIARQVHLSPEKKAMMMQLQKLLEPAVNWLATDYAEFERQTSTLQYVLVGRKLPKKPNVQQL
jgi:2-polyprenyl-3-methyl-5-hydroxy-6-metoxy-1,4-benzoquinol methylase